MRAGKAFRAALLGGLLFCFWTGPALADDAQALATILTGNFSTAAQAEASPAHEARVLRVTPVWSWRQDGPWLYAEEALAESPDQPTRQALLQLKFQPHKGGTEVRPHAIPDAARFRGAWEKPDLLKTLTPEQLTRIEGCELVLQRRQEFEFSGGTPGMECRPKGAPVDYVLVQASAGSRGFKLWERGFDAGGSQVTGPADEGYRYDKVAIGDVPIDE